MAASRKPPSNNAVQAAVADSLGRHVAPRSRVILALSGGRDSVVLLHAVQALRGNFPFDLRALHVHHGLSPHADDWAAFCARLCAEHAIELAIQRVHIAPDDPSGIEAAARSERQRVFAAQDADWLLTAHHQNDQAETLLLQLLRGAGPKGLASMPEARHRQGWRAACLRPLLHVPRTSLHDYALTHQLAWVEDASNQALRFRRNALRQCVLPELDAHFPGAVATLARAAGLQADTAGLLDDLARLDAAAAIQVDRLDCTALAALSDRRACNLLRYFIETRGHSMPSARRLNEALHQLLQARRDARVCLDLGSIELVRFRGGAYLVPARPAPAEPVCWQGEAVLHLPAAAATVRFEATVGDGLKRDALEAAVVTLGVRQGGERLRLHPGGPHRSLKNLLQEQAIPPWRRDQLPLLWCDGRLAWAAGIGLDADLQAGAGEAGIRVQVVDAEGGMPA